MLAMTDTYKLFRVRWLFLKNHFAHPAPDKWTRWGLIGILGSLFFVANYAFFYRMIRYLDELPFKVGEELIFQLLNVIFLTLFVMVLFSAIIASLSIYYISSDLDFLHSQPVSKGSIIRVRFVQTLVNASWVVMIFAFPIFLAYGYYFNVNFGYYFYLMASLPPFVVIPTLLGIIGIMVLMWFFPTDKAYQILSFMGLFFLAWMIIFFRFLSPEKFFYKEVSDEAIIAFVESLKMPEFGFHPSSWITIGVSSWSEQQTGTALWQLVYLYAAAVVLGGVFWWISRKIYFASWRSYQEVKSAPRDKVQKKGTRKPWWLRILPFSSGQKGLFQKDLIVFLRDPSYWSQLFILAALVAVYIFNIVNLPLENIVLKNVVSVLNVGLIGFVLSALASRFVFSTTSLEGNKMWTVYTSPLNMERFLMGKFLMYFPPLLLIGEFLVIVSNILLQVDAYVMRVSVIGILFITIGVVGMAVGMGAMYPKFDYENVSEISGGTGAILFIISSLIYIGLVLVLGARPMYVHFKQMFAGGADDFGVMVFYILIIVLSLYVAIEPMRRGIHSLKTRDF
jgi:ABC-2 type transport system permease protein